MLIAAGMDKGSEAWGLGLKGCLLGVQLQALGIWAGASNSEFRVGVKAQGSKVWKAYEWQS